jgi:hypothetical protein
LALISGSQGYAAELEETGEKQKPLTDGDSRLMTTNSAKTDVCYNVQTAVDAKNKLIIDCLRRVHTPPH